MRKLSFLSLVGIIFYLFLFPSYASVMLYSYTPPYPISHDLSFTGTIEKVELEFFEGFHVEKADKGRSVIVEIGSTVTHMHVKILFSEEDIPSGLALITAIGKNANISFIKEKNNVYDHLLVRTFTIG